MIEEFSSVVNGAIELDFLQKYLRPNDALFVNPTTGFVTSKRSMTSSEVAEYWSNVIFPDASEESYSANYPFARARLLYVIETVIQKLKIEVNSGVSWCDFATGEGVMLELLSTLYPKIKVSGTEHSEFLVSELKKKGFDVRQSDLGKMNLTSSADYDISSLTWTLANAINPVRILTEVISNTRSGGFVCIAESSRIMVPFRKSLSDYLSKVDPADSHPSHFSANTIRCLMELVGLEIVYTNRFFDSDILLIIGKKSDSFKLSNFRDSQMRVVEFMRNWALQTEYYESIRRSNNYP